MKEQCINKSIPILTQYFLRIIFSVNFLKDLISKAFDRINHDLLKARPNAHGRC